MESTYFVVQDGQQTGPYTVSSLRSFIDQGLITLQHLCWKEGMADWTPIQQVLPPETPSPAGHVLPPLKVNPYSPTKPTGPKYLKEEPEIKYTGIGRLYYVGGCVINILITAILSSFSQDPNKVLPLVFAFVFSFMLISLRMRNIGITLWYWLILVVPAINAFFILAIGIYALLAPEGHAQHRNLDKPGKIILWIFVVPVIIAVLIFIFSAAGQFL